MRLQPGEWCPYCEMNACEDGFCACQIVSPADAKPGKPFGLISPEDRKALHDKIAQLQAQLDAKTKALDQATTRAGMYAVDGKIFSKGYTPIGTQANSPELYAHLKEASGE